jgi:hypothetical protein
MHAMNAPRETPGALCAGASDLSVMTQDGFSMEREGSFLIVDSFASVREEGISMEQRTRQRHAELEWVLETRPCDNDWGGTVEFVLSLHDTSSDLELPVLRMQSGLDDFIAALSALRDRLADLQVEAKAQFERIIEADVSQGLQPEDLWAQLAASASEQAMFEHFNGLSEQAREAVAEYVFTNVSMFSGKGPAFAEHYNAASRLLE